MQSDAPASVSGLAPAVGFEPTTKRLTARWPEPSTTQETPRFSPAESVTPSVTGPRSCLYQGCRRAVQRDAAWCSEHLGLLIDRVISSSVGQQRADREARR
jgi:hypothetical protein